MYDFSLKAVFLSISIVPLSNQMSNEGIKPFGTFLNATP